MFGLGTARRHFFVGANTRTIEPDVPVISLTHQPPRTNQYCHSWSNGSIVPVASASAPGSPRRAPWSAPPAARGRRPSWDQPCRPPPPIFSALRPGPSSRSSPALASACPNAKKQNNKPRRISSSLEYNDSGRNKISRKKKEEETRLAGTSVALPHSGDTKKVPHDQKNRRSITP